MAFSPDKKPEHCQDHFRAPIRVSETVPPSPFYLVLSAEEGAEQAKQRPTFPGRERDHT